ncbi:zinc-binding dehydrogenase [Rhodococcus sp. NPDC060090]|uniref:zinc-binding dehydrogenase n=1 Tax=Rhodococcus sp. NPDC060090 TaxID=3347056 RepID=UPI0036545770
MRRLYLHNARIIGSSMHTPTHLAMRMDIAREGHVRAVIAKIFSLNQAARAQEEFGRHRHVGKLVMSPRPADQTTPSFQ